MQRHILVGNKRHAGAVETIADDREPDVGEVAADLVHAPGLGPRFDEGDVVADGEYAQPGERSFTVLIDGLNRQGRLLATDPRQIGLVDAREAGVDDERLPTRYSFDDRRVALVDGASPKGIGEDLLAKGRRGDERAAGRWLIEAVNWLGHTQELDGDVEERGPRHTAAADDGHAGWLIEEGPMLAP
jgi:hypothetical protein